MPITVEWFDKDAQIIISKFIDKWTLEDYMDGETKLRELISPLRSRFDMISDFSDSTYTVPIGSLDMWLSSAEVRHKDFPMWGLTVWIGANRIMQAYFDAGDELSGTIQKHVFTAKTFDEAISMIKKDRKRSEADD